MRVTPWGLAMSKSLAGRKCTGSDHGPQRVTIAVRTAWFGCSDAGCRERSGNWHNIKIQELFVTSSYIWQFCLKGWPLQFDCLLQRTRFCHLSHKLRTRNKFTAVRDSRHPCVLELLPGIVFGLAGNIGNFWMDHKNLPNYLVEDFVIYARTI